MKPEHLLDLLEKIDDDLLIRAKDPSQPAQPSSRRIIARPMLFPIAAAALALCILLAAFAALKSAQPGPTPPSLTADSTENPGTGTAAWTPPDLPPPATLNAAVSPESTVSDPLTFLVGSSLEVSGAPDAAPPAFQFGSTGIVVECAAVKSFPDTYYRLDTSSVRAPSPYRLIQMQTIRVLHGEGVPQDFLYLLPASLFVDLTAYDSLLISLDQLGAENYVLRNGTQARMETYPLPLFHDSQDHPDLGDMIAFSEGIFDESLWQTPSWRYGYQFGRHLLDEEAPYLVVHRGDSLEEAAAGILADIAEWKKHLGDAYSPPRVLTLEGKTEEARQALAEVAPFEKGVYAQALVSGANGTRAARFTRFIGGFQTEETILINLDTGEVTRSEAAYTEADLQSVADLSAAIGALSAAYADQIPSPPHGLPEEACTLRSLAFYGWYAKCGDRVVGVVKTVWIYYVGDVWSQVYYDDSYLLFESGKAGEAIDRDALTALIGDRNVYTGSYGMVIAVAVC